MPDEFSRSLGNIIRKWNFICTGTKLKFQNQFILFLFKFVHPSAVLVHFTVIPYFFLMRTIQTNLRKLSFWVTT